MFFGRGTPLKSTVDSKQHAENTNNVTLPPTAVAAGHATRVCVAGAWCTAVKAGCFIGRCGPSSVITTSLSSAVQLCRRVCGVSYAPRKITVWIGGSRPHCNGSTERSKLFLGRKTKHAVSYLDTKLAVKKCNSSTE